MEKSQSEYNIINESQVFHSYLFQIPPGPFSSYQQLFMYIMILNVPSLDSFDIQLVRGNRIIDL